MTITMHIDGIPVQIDWDPVRARFYGVAQVPGGAVTIHGRSVDELTAAFRDTLKAQQEALAAATAVE